MSGEPPKLPESPKDNEHWYPEFPENKEFNAALLNGDFEANGGGILPHPKYGVACERDDWRSVFQVCLVCPVCVVLGVPESIESILSRFRRTDSVRRVGIN